MKETIKNYDWYKVILYILPTKRTYFYHKPASSEKAWPIAWVNIKSKVVEMTWSPWRYSALPMQNSRAVNMMCFLNQGGKFWQFFSQYIDWFDTYQLFLPFLSAQNSCDHDTETMQVKWLLSIQCFIAVFLCTNSEKHIKETSEISFTITGTLI